MSNMKLQLKQLQSMIANFKQQNVNDTSNIFNQISIASQLDACE